MVLSCARPSALGGQNGVRERRNSALDDHPPAVRPELKLQPQVFAFGEVRQAPLLRAGGQIAATTGDASPPLSFGPLASEASHTVPRPHGFGRSHELSRSAAFPRPAPSMAPMASVAGLLLLAAEQARQEPPDSVLLVVRLEPTISTICFSLPKPPHDTEKLATESATDFGGSVSKARLPPM